MDFQLSTAHDLDRGLGHTASLIDLYLHAELYWNQKNFLWTIRRMYVYMDADGRMDIWHFI